MNLQVVGRITIAGAATSVGDGCGFELIGTFKRVSGVVDQINVDHQIASDKDFNGNAGFAAPTGTTFGVDATAVAVECSGAVNAGTAEWRGRGFITIV
jgi:hypothetical protein